MTTPCHLPDADAADEFAKLRGNKLSHVNNSRPQPRRVSLSKNFYSSKIITTMMFALLAEIRGGINIRNESICSCLGQHC